jgi:hypothetical protein
MANDKKAKKDAFRAKTVPERSKEIVGQGVIPAAWDSLSDLINLADETGDEALHKWAQNMMEDTFFSNPHYQSKLEYMIDFLEKRFKKKLYDKQKDGLGKDHLDLTQDAIFKMLSEETSGLTVTDAETEQELKQKLYLVATSIFKDAFKSIEHSIMTPAQDHDLEDDGKRSSLQSGAGNQKEIDSYNARLKADKDKYREEQKSKHGPVKTIIPDDKKANQITEEKADDFLRQRNKESERKTKKS